MNKSRLILLLMTLACMAATSSVWAVTATFNFGDTQQLMAMGLAVPTSSSRTYITSPITVNGVTLTPSAETSPQVTYYQSKYNLYLFSGTAITLTAPAGKHITQLDFDARYLSIEATVNTGTLNGLQWTGNASSVTIQATGSNTIYIIDVTCQDAITMHNATGLGEFKNLPNGSVARLYIPDENNCRVTYVSEDGAEVYLRDNTGALYLDNIDACPAFKVNQHIAGWITGKCVNNNGLPTLTSWGNATNTNQLVIANPVTEAQVAPATIESNDSHNHAANWVTINDLHINGSTATHNQDVYTINNMYGLAGESNYQAPYNGAIIDFTGLVVPTAHSWTLVPTAQLGHRPITYVIDENQEFAAPTTSIGNASVRVVRTLVKNEWQTLVLPFTTSDLDATIVTPLSLNNGTLNTSQVGTIRAGMPYIVRPNSNITQLVYNDVTLTSDSPFPIGGMTGMYNHTFLNPGTQAIALVSKNGQSMLLSVNAEDIPTTHAQMQGVNLLNINGQRISQYGDVNLDGATDVADINVIINAIIAPQGDNYNTDLNFDNTTDVADINCAINVIMSQSNGVQGYEWRAKRNNNTK